MNLGLKFLLCLNEKWFNSFFKKIVRYYEFRVEISIMSKWKMI